MRIAGEVPRAGERRLRWWRQQLVGVEEAQLGDEHVDLGGGVGRGLGEEIGQVRVARVEGQRALEVLRGLGVALLAEEGPARGRLRSCLASAANVATGSGNYRRRGDRAPLATCAARFWNGLAVLKFHGQKPEVIPPGGADPRPVRLVPFVTRYPDIPLDGTVVADRIPTDEADTPKRLFTRLQHKLVRWFSPDAGRACRRSRRTRSRR